VALSRSIPGVMRAACLVQTQQTAARARAVVELAIGKEPQTLVAEAVARVRHPGLNRLLASFTQEPEIREALLGMEVPSGDPDAFSGQGQSASCSSAPTWPIQRLRRAAELAQYLCAFGREEREVLYVATLLQGCQPLLNRGLQNTASQQDVLRTLVRKSLQQLEERYPRQAWLLRQSMGWGLEDEVDDFYVPRLQRSILRSLAQVLTPPTGLKLPLDVNEPAHHSETRH
jgi:DNA polymerase III psi subunit